MLKMRLAYLRAAVLGIPEIYQSQGLVAATRMFVRETIGAFKPVRAF